MSYSEIEFDSTVDSNCEKQNVMDDAGMLTHTIPIRERIFIGIEFRSQIFHVQ